MANFIKVAGVNPPQDRPRVDMLDGLLPDAGALFLIDPANAARPWAAGVPANGASVPNLASSQLGALTGVSSDSIVEYGDPANMKTQRTAKGGIHLAPVPGATANTHYYRINAAAGVAQHVFNNPTHDYYFSQWITVTRKAEGTGAPSFTGSVGYDANSFLAHLYLSQSNVGAYPHNGNAGIWLSSQTTNYTPVDTPLRAQVATSNWMKANVASAPDTVGQIRVHALQAGNGAVVGNTYNPRPAFIMYRSYLEDLTVSGRTHAQVSAMDTELFTRDVLTSGGRYYGDTYTAPANL